MKKVTEQFPDDVEAWIELAGILEENNITVCFCGILSTHLHVHIYVLSCVSSAKSTFKPSLKHAHSM